MVGSQDSSQTLQGVLTQVAGFVVFAHPRQGEGQAGRHPQGVGMVRAEHFAASVRAVLR